MNLDRVERNSQTNTQNFEVEPRCTPTCKLATGIILLSSFLVLETARNVYRAHQINTTMMEENHAVANVVIWTISGLTTWAIWRCIPRPHQN